MQADGCVFAARHAETWCSAQTSAEGGARHGRKAKGPTFSSTKTLVSSCRSKGWRPNRDSTSARTSLLKALRSDPTGGWGAHGRPVTAEAQVASLRWTESSGLRRCSNGRPQGDALPYSQALLSLPPPLIQTLPSPRRCVRTKDMQSRMSSSVTADCGRGQAGTGMHGTQTGWMLQAAGMAQQGVQAAGSCRVHVSTMQRRRD